MSFSDEIAKRVSERHCLLRVKPARDITAELSSIGSGVYQATFSYNLAGIVRNGSTTLTPTASNPPVSNDTYYYDQATSTLKVKLASAPNASSNILIASHYLYFSSGHSVYKSDPDDSGTSEVFWNPIIRDEPSISQTIENIEAGILTVSNFSIELINEGEALNEYFGDSDSFYQKTAELWISVNGLVQKSYVGKIDSVSLSRESVVFTVFDDFSRMHLPCYMGDAASECYNTTSRLRDFFEPVPFVFGQTPGGIDYNAMTLTDEDPVAPGPGTDRITGYLIDYRKCLRASYNANVNSAVTGSTNRGPLLVARTSGDFKTLDFGTVTALKIRPTNSGGYDSYYTLRGQNYAFLYVATSGSNIEVGDSFTFSHSSLNSGATQYAIVVGVVTSGSVQAHGLYCILKSRSNVTATINLTTSGLTMNSNQAPAVMIRQKTVSDGYDGLAFLAYGKDFTYSISTLSSGNKRMTITLVSNFETATNIDGTLYHGSLATFHPDSTDVFFKVSQSSSYSSHGKAVEACLASLGISANASSISAADAALSASVNMTIPQPEDSEYGSYFKYLQMILRSTLSYIRMAQSSSEAHYKLLEAPSSGEDIDDDVYSDERGVSVEIDYKDIVTSITFRNKNNGQVATSTNDAARHLHGIENRITYDHVLSSISGRSAAILAFLSKRKATYRFKVPTQLLASVVGDDVTLTASQILGSSVSKNLKITYLEKSSDAVNVEARDLLGL